MIFKKKAEKPEFKFHLVSVFASHWHFKATTPITNETIDIHFDEQTGLVSSRADIFSSEGQAFLFEQAASFAIVRLIYTFKATKSYRAITFTL